MSFLTIIISEDHTNDQYILKPLIEKLLAQLGKPRATVSLVTNPRLNGYEHAKEQIDAICERYKFAQLILFLPDNDCNLNRQKNLLVIEKAKQSEGYRFCAQSAVQEVETWLLAGYTNQQLKTRNFTEVRDDCSVKENVFEPFLRTYGNDNPGGGRAELMVGALSEFRRITSRCAEIGDLAMRIKELID
jgi:hypothetical protein